MKNYKEVNKQQMSCKYGQSVSSKEIKYLIQLYLYQNHLY